MTICRCAAPRQWPRRWSRRDARKDRLLIAAHGSSQSTSPQGDLDAYAFDRRVTVRLDGTAVVQSSYGQRRVHAVRWPRGGDAT